LISRNLATEGGQTHGHQVDRLDMDAIIMPNMCKIIHFYGIVSEACPSDDIRILSPSIRPDNVRS